LWRLRPRGSFFSPSAALALFVFSPSLIVHFSVATTDGAATLFIFAAAWGLVRSQQQPTWKRTFWLGMLPA
jgi:4-amino-4-deoxy-L-arabinose transferase-like glycosyltransferase